MNKKSIWFIIVLAVVLGLSLNTVNVGTAQDQPTIVQMTGDKDSVWLATSNNKLVYCWWEDDPGRLDKLAQCRALNR